jgi:hypothetical protein
MKNPNNPGQFESSSPLAVSVTIDEIPLLKNMVEKLAHRRYDIGYANEPMPDGLKAVETSSIESYVSGNLDLFDKEDQLSIAYTTCFTFTCIKAAGSDNTLRWVNSLS